MTNPLGKLKRKQEDKEKAFVNTLILTESSFCLVNVYITRMQRYCIAMKFKAKEEETVCVPEHSVCIFTWSSIIAIFHVDWETEGMIKVFPKEIFPQLF